MMIGIFAGLAAGALWGLTFVAPNLVQPFSPFDLAVLRNLIFGGVSLALIGIFARSRLHLDGRGIRLAMLLGLLGYSGYYLFVAYAVKYAGPAISALVIGSLPVLLAVVGNLREKTVSWRKLAVPLGLIVVGLAIVNIGSMRSPGGGRSEAEILFGFLLAVGGLLCWLAYGVINAEALKAREVDTLIWTSWQGVGAALGMVVAMPIGISIGWSRLADISLMSGAASSLWFWAIVTGALSSWVATFAWVMASKRLSVALAAQLIVSETIFGMLYGFLVETRWPDAHESIGAALLFLGVIVGIRVLSRPALQVEK